MNDELDEEIRKQGYFMEEEKRCPICNSKRISKIETFQVWTIKNLSSGKIIDRNTQLSPYGRVFHSYKCRKCGWESVNMNE